MADVFDPIFDELSAINTELAGLEVRLRTLEQNSAPTAPAAGGGSAGGAVLGPSDRPPGAPVVWRSLSAQQRAVLWPEFIDFVIWFADAYELTTEQLPRQCWWQHESVVEELTALWTSRASAYAAEEDVGASPYLWQDGAARAVERIGRSWLSGCLNGFHEPKSRVSFTSEDGAYRLEVVEAGPPTSRDGPA